MSYADKTLTCQDCGIDFVFTAGEQEFYAQKGFTNQPGTGNRPHWHKDFDEWWIVLAGQLQWELTGGVVIQAAKDDIVWVPRGTVHHIKNVGDENTLRLAIAMPPAIHYASPCEQCGYTDDGPREWCA